MGRRQSGRTVSLLQRQREDAVEQARMEVLRAFVAQLRREYAHLWPEQTTPGVRSTSAQWPECWEQHPGFVTQLQFLLDWHSSLEAGDATGGFLEAADWQHYLEYTIRGAVREISQRICKLGHRDPASAAGRPQVAAPAVFSVPGRAQRHTPAPAPAPSPHWSDGVR